jgi:hypothetical protein
MLFSSSPKVHYCCHKSLKFDLMSHHLRSVSTSAPNFSAIHFVVSCLRLDYMHWLLHAPRLKYLFLNQIAYRPPTSLVCWSLLRSLHRMTRRALQRSPNELASRTNTGSAVQILGSLLAAGNLERASPHQKPSQYCAHWLAPRCRYQLVTGVYSLEIL